MKLGLIARADKTGLGYQTKEFYDHMKPAKTMVVDIGHLNGNGQHPEWYPGAQLVKGFPDQNDIEEFLQGLDVVFIAESPYNYWLLERARQLGVKTAIQYNYEFFDWFVYDRPKPDMLIAPSRWHYAEVDEWCRANGVQHVYLHCPVNRDLLPFKQVTRAHRFLHVAGKPAAHDRNGTYAVIAASKYVKAPDMEIVVHFQGEQGLKHQLTDTTAEYRQAAERDGNPEKLRIRVREYENYQDVFAAAHVLLLPRRYGGNCLPMNEALSCGMPVVMPDISPNNEFLPKNWLIPAAVTSRFQPRAEVDIYSIDPVTLAAKIDEFAVMNRSQMLFESYTADKLAQKISWLALTQQYRQALEGLCR